MPDGEPGASGPEFAAQVDAFLLAMGTPSRQPEPRLAERFASVELQRVPSDGGALAAWRLGADSAVLLVHGWEDNHSLWSPLIESLAQRGRSVVAFDMPAHGYSEGEWGLNPEAVDAVFAVSNALGPIDAVVGHSSGAGVVALALTEGLCVDRVVLIAPPLRGDDRFQRYAQRLGVPRDVAAAAKAFYEKRLGRERAAFDPRAALQRLDVRLLLIHSVDDERMPFSDSLEVAAQLHDGELFAVEGLTHRRTARDLEVVERVSDFVSA